MLSDELKSALAMAAGDAAAAHDRRSNELQRAVYDAVDLLKSQCWPPERIIAHLRDFIRDLPASRQYPLVTDPLTEWCLKRYYDAPARGDIPHS